jgi:uncharacterized membrane protein YfcA
VLPPKRDLKPCRNVFFRVHINHPVFLFFAAVLAGTINSVAGGGSFITFPALIFTGIPPIPANATNTAAVWPGTVASTVAYRKAFTRQAFHLLPALMGTGIVGGFLGARILLITPQATFMRIVPWLLLGATLLFVLSGRITGWIRGRANLKSGEAVGGSGTPRTLLVGVLFLELLVSIYVGYFGAGVGILFLSLLALLGLEDIHALNGMKTLLVSIVNGVALVTFVFAHVIVWPQALLMLVGALIGGYGGAWVAQKMNPQHVRGLVIVIGFAMSAYFFIRKG